MSTDNSKDEVILGRCAISRPATALFRIIGPSYVESFSEAPVAFIVSHKPAENTRSMWPIFTALSFREAVKRVTMHTLEELQQSPAPSYAFELMCGAIKRALVGLGNTVLPRESTPHPFVSVEGGIDVYMPEGHGDIAASVRSVRLVSSILSPAFALECDIDGVRRFFEIELRRGYRTRQMKAFVRSL